MVKKEVFHCDNCQKQSPSFTQGAELPYVHGWRSLTNFEFKASSEYKHEIILKHFCSNECMLSFIDKFIREQEDALEQAQARHTAHERQPQPLLTNVIKSHLAKF